MRWGGLLESAHWAGSNLPALALVGLVRGGGIFASDERLVAALDAADAAETARVEITS